MSAKSYYQAHKDVWHNVYYQRQLERLKNPSVLAKKRECNREYMRRTRQDKILLYRKNKAFFVSILGGSCSACGYSANIDALQFDHKDPSTKLGNVTRLFSMKDRTRAAEEVEKCQLLCANCHAIKTANEGSTRKGRRRVERTTGIL